MFLLLLNLLSAGDAWVQKNADAAKKNLDFAIERRKSVSQELLEFMATDDPKKAREVNAILGTARPLKEHVDSQDWNWFYSPEANRVITEFLETAKTDFEEGQKPQMLKDYFRSQPGKALAIAVGQIAQVLHEKDPARADNPELNWSGRLL